MFSTEEKRMTGEKRADRSLTKTGLTKPRWLASGSAIAAAIALAAIPSKTDAQTVGPRISPNQSFQANHDLDPTIGGTHTIGPNQDVVNLFSQETVVNWTPLDTNTIDTTQDLINILPATTELLFTGPAAGYTVVNRVLPASTPSGVRAIHFGGQVTSRLGTTTGAIGGNVWFYSPGGIAVGQTARFDIGSLLLTTTDLDLSGGLPCPFGGTISATGNVGGGNIVIEGSDSDRGIFATAENSYIAMIGRRIIQRGDVFANGAAAYVATEQAELTINGNNLFDIRIPVGAGTTDSIGIDHSGATRGPAQTSSGDIHSIYMVAVPKNQAMTMLLGGNIGHPLSASIGTSDGQVILSAGGNVETAGSFSNDIDTTVDPSRNANIDFTGGNLTGFVRAFANNNISLTSTAGNNISTSAQNRDRGADFTAGDSISITAGTGSSIDLTSTGLRSDIFFNAANDINILVNPGATIDVAGDFELNAFDATQGGNVDIDIIGPGSRVAGSGEFNVNGTFNIQAGVVGTRSRSASVDDGTDTFGGTIDVDIVQGGLLGIDASAGFASRDSVFSASTSAHHGTVTGADSFGGSVDFNIDGAGSTLDVVGFAGLELEARGNSTSTFRGTSTGGSGTGGTVNLNVNGGTITASGLVLDAGADGSSNASSNTNESLNSAFSGDVTANFTGATLDIANLELNTEADAARSFDAAGNLISGNAAGGDLTVTFDNTNLNGISLGLNGDAFRTNNVLSGQVAPGDEGSTTLNILNGSALTLTGRFNMSGAASADADGASSAADLNLLIDNATFSAANINLDNFRRTNAPAGSSDGTPGDINFTIRNGGSATAGTLSMSAGAISGAPGGQARAGNVNLLVDAGTLTLTEATDTSLSINTSGIGADNDGSTGVVGPGLGVGGDIDITLQGGGTMTMGTASFRGDGLIAGVFDGAGIAPAGEGGSRCRRRGYFQPERQHFSQQPISPFPRLESRQTAAVPQFLTPLSDLYPMSSEMAAPEQAAMLPSTCAVPM